MKKFYINHYTGMTKDSEFQVLLSALEEAGLYDERRGRQYCLMRRPDGGYEERRFLYLWDDRAEAEEFLSGLRKRGHRAWRVFEADVIPVYELLDPRALELPDCPVVVRIEPAPFTDSLGEYALRVWVILADGTPDGDRTWAKLQPIFDRIHEVLWSALPLYGAQLWPNVWFRTETEYAEQMAHAS
jgi:hypothetical protein